MRISDWSSDVCSSDLQALFAERSSLADATRRVACDSITESADPHHRIATPRIQQLLSALAETHRTPQAWDARVYRGDIAPVAVWKDGRAAMLPMLYQAHPHPDPVSYRHRTCLKGIFGKIGRASCRERVCH